MSVHTLTTAYDLSNVSQDADDGKEWKDYLDPIGENITHRDIEFNNDGTKMYLIHAWGNEQMIEYDLSTPYLPSTASVSSVLDLNDINQDIIQDFEFDDDGTRMYLQESGAAVDTHKIYVYKLTTPFAISSAKYVGKLLNFFQAGGTGQALPLGLDFSADGMKLYQVAYSHDGATDPPDFIYQYDLSCPYGIVICENDTLSNTGAQIEFAKNVIRKNTSTVFKRFEWLRRNEGKNNLNSNNINLNIYNPVLASLKNKLKGSFNEKKYSQVSLGEKKSIKNKSNNWSYWSHGDISFGRTGDTATSNPSEIRVSGLMFGADKKINNDTFFGAAIRYGNDNIELISSNGLKLDTESLTLNLYSTIPVNNNSNLNALLGVSLLRMDQLYSSTLAGERNGKQIFTAINLTPESGYGNFNIMPTVKLEYGITQFSEYTDFGSSSTTNSIDIHEALEFKTGSVAAGFKFDNSIEINDGKLSRNGSLEYINDLTPDIDYKFKNHIDNVTTHKTVHAYAINNIKGNVGFELLYESGYTFALNYERIQGLDYGGHQDSIFFKLGHVREEESEFAFNYKPLNNNQMELSYVKDVNGFDVKINSNYSLTSKIPDYGANIEVSSVF